MTDCVLNINRNVLKFAITAPMWKYQPILLTDYYYYFFLMPITDIFATIIYQSNGRLHKTHSCVYTVHKWCTAKSTMQSQRDPIKICEIVYSGWGVKRTEDRSDKSIIFVPSIAKVIYVNHCTFGFSPTFKYGCHSWNFAVNS